MMPDIKEYKEKKQELISLVGKCQLTGKKISKESECEIYDINENDSIFVHMSIINLINNSSIIITKRDENYSIISFKKHEYCPFHYYWSINLSNGLVVFDDNFNNMGSLKISNSWFRVQNYCYFHNLFVTGFRFYEHGRIHNYDISKIDGIFMSTVHAGEIGSTTRDIAKNIGIIKDGHIYVTKYTIGVPYIIHENREISENEQFCFMFNRKNKK